MKRHTIKFTKDDITNVYLQSHQWDTWVEITLESGSEIRSHSIELKDLILNKHKSILLSVHINIIGYYMIMESI